MFDFKEWLIKLKTPEGIIVLLSLLFTTIGWILILSGHFRGFEGWYVEKSKLNYDATLMWITVIINFFAFVEDQPIAGIIAAGFVYSYMSWLFGFTHKIPRSPNRAVFAGLVFAWIGVFGSFIGPICRREKGLNVKAKELFAVAVIAFLDLVGLIMIWIADKGFNVIMEPLFVGLFFLAAVLLSSQSAQYITVFLASVLFHRLFLKGLSNVGENSVAAIGFFFCWVSMLFVLIFLAYKYWKVKGQDYQPLAK